MRKSSSLLAAVLLATALVAPVSAHDLHKFADTSRIVSIGGSLTEIFYELGEEGVLVARDQTALYPAAARDLPDVGYSRALAPEGVLAVNPTGLLVIGGSGPPEALDVLSHAGVEYQTVHESYSAEGVVLKVRSVGLALGAEEKAEALATKLEGEFAALKARTDAVAEKKKVLFVLSYQNGQIQASGTGTAANGMIELAGGENVISEFEGYRPLSDEAIMAAAPDVILLMDRGDGTPGLVDEVLSHPAIALTPAGQSKAALRLEGSYLLNFGPRAAAAANEVTDFLYGAQ